MIPHGKKQIEILAPAGSYEQLVAAVRSGADAVYLGAGGLNARRNAENFSDFSRLREAVEYCHASGVDVHLTANILVNTCRCSRYGHARLHSDVAAFSRRCYDSL